QISARPSLWDELIPRGEAEHLLWLQVSATTTSAGSAAYVAAQGQGGCSSRERTAGWSTPLRGMFKPAAVQEQPSAIFCSGGDFLWNGNGPLSQHNGALGFHDHHAAQHSGRRVRILQLDQPTFALMA